MNPDFEGLLFALARRDVHFVLVGGYSAMLHGSSLMTRDIDIACDMAPANLGRLFDALQPLNPVYRLDPAAHASRDDWNKIYLRTDIGVLDCLGVVRGLGDYSACLDRSTKLNLGGIEINILSLDALIDAKRAMGRPRDLLTAQELEIIREQTNRPTG